MTAGLRERKKVHTREHISNIATGLFIAQGYAATTIAQIAEAADVARMTVTNYFALKEDLVFDRHERMASMWSRAVAERIDIGPLEAMRRHHLERIAAHDPTLGFVGLPFARMIRDSPALLVRERQILDAQEDLLAQTLSVEFASSPADLRPRLAAANLAGLTRVLYYEGRRRLLVGEATGAIAVAVRRAARAGYRTVETTLPPAYRRP